MRFQPESDSRINGVSPWASPQRSALSHSPDPDPGPQFHQAGQCPQELTAPYTALAFAVCFVAFFPFQIAFLHMGVLGHKGVFSSLWSQMSTESFQQYQKCKHLE